MSKIWMISSDCHAGALPATYEEYMPKRYHEASRAWWVVYAREMMQRAGTFFDQEAVEAFEEQSGETRGLMSPKTKDQLALSDADLVKMLSDETSAFSPRRGEFDIDVREKELDGDGVAAEILFPQMVPFGAGLLQYRKPISPDENLVGIQAYNRWLADFCRRSPARHLGVAIINVDDIDATVKEIREAKASGLHGGVLLPTSTGEHPFYHDERYEPLWAVCAELAMPLHTHSGWSPDYGDGPFSTAMYITEVDMWAQRPFAALIWSGVFDRHPDLELVMTETGCSWILEKLRNLEFKAANPIFKYFTRDLQLEPREYFQRNCWMGASFLTPAESEDRHRIGVDRLMYGTDYPHLEGTFPNTLEELRKVFGTMPEDELRKILGGNALEVFPIDREALAPVVERVGWQLSDLRQEA